MVGGGLGAPGEGLRVLGLLATSGLAAALSAVQLWPFLQVLAISSRDGGMSYLAAAEKSLVAVQLLDLVSPLQFLESPADGRFLRSITLGGVGLGAAALGLASLLGRRTEGASGLRPSWALFGGIGGCLRAAGSWSCHAGPPAPLRAAPADPDDPLPREVRPRTVAGRLPARRRGLGPGG